MKNNKYYLKFSLVVVYLVSIVLANFVVSRYGASVSIITAFFFIGLNITTRDYLHEVWEDNLKRNMFLLILIGSVLSLFFNAGRIAIASFSAFAISETVDAICYQFLKNKNKDKIIRVNGSNIVSSIADSFIFPYLAFGSFLPWIVFGQIVAKIGGGFVWFWVISRIRKSMVK